MSVEQFKAQREMEILKADAERLTELKTFLSAHNNPGNRRRVEEITEELKRIEARLAVLDGIV